MELADGGRVQQETSASEWKLIWATIWIHHRNNCFVIVRNMVWGSQKHTKKARITHNSLAWHDQITELDILQLSLLAKNANMHICETKNNTRPPAKWHGISIEWAGSNWAILPDNFQRKMLSKIFTAAICRSDQIIHSKAPDLRRSSPNAAQNMHIKQWKSSHKSNKGQLIHRNIELNIFGPLTRFAH